MLNYKTDCHTETTVNVAVYAIPFFNSLRQAVEPNRNQAVNGTGPLFLIEPELNNIFCVIFELNLNRSKLKYCFEPVHNGMVQNHNFVILVQLSYQPVTLLLTPGLHCQTQILTMTCMGICRQASCHKIAKIPTQRCSKITSSQQKLE